MARRLDARAADFSRAFDALLSDKRETAEDVAASVRAIIADVRARGEAAVLEYTHSFDRFALSLDRMRVTRAEIDEAEAQCAKETLAALDLAAARIESYHRRQIPQDEKYTDDTGATLGWRWTPLESVGLYVPGGTAAYPSSVLMNAIPAKVAGVARIVMVTPASRGAIPPLTLMAAKIAGVSEIYRVGGAQAI
ncbi:MAG TPA: histidinol dehydrogenase, partial [Rhizomicrobium sp.]|nr:histidinol dehydrogenase [Rhizomicrobium sp.]